MTPASLDILKGLRVLVVEDEYLIAMALIDELEAVGALVLGPAGSVESALATIHREGPAAAVLDVDLRGELVTPVADVLALRKIPYILTTGLDSQALPIRYEGVPKCAKPAPATEVLQILRCVLQSRNDDRAA